ncbi:CdaR family transcriptional regulator [Knoellia subterranea]|uniref:CdaR family transcriptional regulator n=1 Tax=Knoellia subterranea KCTC 19937 TaxID=1385521 RepID=A0A0A0JQW9_9MICO|nr:CdaR family transcriptional regulator [Knoellia subterranea]KGN37966.1 hypothetical protein N803_12960 [Knoellia subterranea KCTC 19937]
MQELLGRLSALDPDASQGLRVIACFDELVAGNVNTRALLSAAASLAGCVAGFHREGSGQVVRVTPRAQLAEPPASAIPPALGAGPEANAVEAATGLTVWLERDGLPHANDAIILERLALSVRVRHGGGRAGDRRRALGVLLDGSVPVDERLSAAARLGLAASARYRVVAAPLFATWARHPEVPEDVVPTPFGPIHALVVRADAEPPECTPRGTGSAAVPAQLHRSFLAAVVALRLCSPPAVRSVDADDYGGLVDVLVDTPAETPLADVDLLEPVMGIPWGESTVDALVRAGSVRQAARLGGVHHSTMQSRVDAMTTALGFDPLDGFGRTRLGLAHLLWRLRDSTVLELPAPEPGRAPTGSRSANAG